MSYVTEIYEYSFDQKAETVYVEAEVEDSVMIAPQTFWDPEEWAPGRCAAQIFWPDEDKAPTKKELLDYCNSRNIEWIFIPFDEQ
tara:strand:+ start:17 stop:271 length:255 start_codon:yes stop_codon:yes gene_type:complete